MMGITRKRRERGEEMSKQTKQMITDTTQLFQEISLIIDQSKQQVVSAVNNALTVLFWHIGKKIDTYVLHHKRAEYGKQIVVTLSRQLSWSHFLALIRQPDYQAARKYWYKLKERLKKENSESVTSCHQLKIKTTGGKKYLAGDAEDNND
jgi:hypothetical protein